MKRFIYLILLLCLVLSSFAKKKGDTKVQRQALPAADARKLSYFYNEMIKQHINDNATDVYSLATYCKDIDPDAPEVLCELVYCLDALNEDSLALGYIQRVVELDPENDDYLRLLALHYFRNGMMDEAIKVAEKLEKMHSRHSEIYKRLPTLYQLQGRWKDAIAMLNRQEVLEGRQYETTIQKVNIYLEHNKKSKAFAELEALEKEFPNDMQVPLAYSNVYIDLEEYDKAKECIQRIKTMEDGNLIYDMTMLNFYRTIWDSVYYEPMRDSLIYDKQTDEHLRLYALYLLKRDLEVEPDEAQTMMHTLDSIYTLCPSSEIHDMRVFYRERNGCSVDSVISAIQDWLEVDLTNSLALRSLIYYYTVEKDYPHAEETARKALTYYPNDPSLLYSLGDALTQQDRAEEAIEAYLTSLKQSEEDNDPYQKFLLYMSLAENYHELGRDEECFAAYDSCLVYNSEDTYCLNNYAYYLALKGEQLDKAEKMSYRTIKIEPLNKSYLDTYAWIQYIRKNLSMAKFYIDRVVSPSADDETLLNSEDLSSIVLQHAAEIYTASGLTQRAERYQRLSQEMKDKEDKEQE